MKMKMLDFTPILSMHLRCYSYANNSELLTLLVDIEDETSLELIEKTLVSNILLFMMHDIRLSNTNLFEMAIDATNDDCKTNLYIDTDIISDIEKYMDTFKKIYKNILHMVSDINKYYWHGFVINDMVGYKIIVEEVDRGYKDREEYSYVYDRKNVTGLLSGIGTY